MNTAGYKRSYHPLIILLYHSNMLSPEELAKIPRSTKKNWNKFSHESYYGYEMAAEYICEFEAIKNVLTNKHMRYGLQCLSALSYGYKDIVSDYAEKKKNLRNNAEKITFAIYRLSKKANISLSQSCRIFGVNRSWYYRYVAKRNCNKSPNHKCYRTHPNQLTFKDIQVIDKLIHNPENRTMTKTTLYYKAIRNNIIACGLSTFFKYATILGYKGSDKLKNEPRTPGFRASSPFEWLHVDVTHVQTKLDGVQYVAFLKDNYSKALLGVKSMPTRPTSRFIRDLVIEAFDKFHLINHPNPVVIASDGGAENKGLLLDWIDQLVTTNTVRKVTAKTPCFPFSNSMSESVHSIYKSEFMQRRHSLNKEDHHKDLERFMDYYNHKRFFGEHYGLTALEVLNGKIPDKSAFKETIQKARKARIEENQKFKGCPLVC